MDLPIVRGWGARTLALLLGSALALPCVLLALTIRRPRPAVDPRIELAGTLHDQWALLEANRSAAPLAPLPGSDPLFREEPIPESLARLLFPQLVRSSSGVVYEPAGYYRFRGGLRRTIPFADSPSGQWRFATNSLGLREDEELAEPRPRWSVLVAGDSQTEGYCDNQDSFPNRLEALLEERLGAGEVEVLNAGKSGYQLYNDLGVLERFRERRPDVFVMALYAGNDFAEALALAHFFERTTLPRCEPCERTSLAALADPSCSTWCSQYLRQAQLFGHHPEQRVVALRSACAVVAETARRCAARGTRFLLLAIPAARDAQPRLYGGHERCAELLRCRAEDLEIGAELTRALLGFARARGIACLDLLPLLRAQAAPMYWARDLHLDVEANALVARALADELRGLAD